MTVALCFNELSLADPAADIAAARQWVDGLVQTLLALASHGANSPLLGIDGLHNLPLANDYPLAKWLNDHAVAREQRTYLRSKLTQAAPLVGGDIGGPGDETDLWDFQHAGRSAVGLGTAVRLGGLAVSILSSAQWDHPELEIRVTRLGADDKIAESAVAVRSAARPGHVDAHAGWLSDSRRTVRDFADLWARRATLFASLEFCDSVRDQLQAISPGNPAWHAIAKRLWELEDYFSGWSQGAFVPEAMPCKTTPESHATLEQYGAPRTFLCPDGQHRVFSWHCRFTPNAGRIHFLPNVATRRCIIGYIGSKLPTVGDPT